MNPTISPEELALLILKTPILIIDARGGAEAHKSYSSCHIPNALFVDLETELSGKSPDPAIGGRHPLPSPRQFANVLTSLGINSDSAVVVYDDKCGANAAARFWWMMRSIGHENIQVLDGGIAGWLRAGYSTETGPVRRVASAEAYQPAHPEQGWLLPLANIDMVDAARKSADYCVIDVREQFRFRGESEPIDLIAGHIPGAINLAYVKNLNADGFFLDRVKLEKRFAEIYSRHQPERVIVHCGSGVTACHTLLAMEIAGFSGAELYVGSWSEWSRNSRPVATGAG